MEEKELAVIFKARDIKNDTRLIPINCVIGHYIKSEDIFIDEEGFGYSHFSRFIPGRSYGVRQNLKDLMQKFSIKDENEMKKKYLSLFKKGYYYVGLNEKTISLFYYQSLSSKEFFICKDVDTIKVSDLYPNKDDEIEEKENSKDSVLHVDTKYLREYTKKYVISQDEAIDKIITTIWRNINNKMTSSTKNILVSGSTGVGKTEIFRIIAKQIGIPIIKCDANEYTAAGYVGKDVEDMLRDLLYKANGDINKASHGIIIIDEFDKLAGTGKNNEVNTTKVQDALLTMIEGAVYKIKYKNSVYDFDTSKITFVGIGAFARATKINNKIIGFNSNTIIDDEILSDDVLKKYGIEQEILGRFSVRVILKDLEVKDLFQIIKVGEANSLKEEIEFLDSMGIDVIFVDELLINIAKKAYSYKCGARGISRVVSDIFSDILKEISDKDGMYKRLEIQPEIVDDKKRYVLSK